MGGREVVGDNDNMMFTEDELQFILELKRKIPNFCVCTENELEQ